MTKMEEKLISALAEALEMDSTRISTGDKFRDYETYSSLSELSLLAMLDSEFGIEVEMSEFVKYQTVDDLIQLVSNR